MLSQEEITDQQVLLTTYRRSRAILFNQYAKYGSASVPTHILHGIYEAQDAIQRIKKTLRENHIDIENHPDDDLFKDIEDLFNRDVKHAPPSLAVHMRRNFQTLIDERTKGFVGRDFVFEEIDKQLKNDHFRSGYIIISGEPGIGKTALIGHLANRRQYVHHFNVAAQGIRSTKTFLENVCARLILRYELQQKYPMLWPEATQDSNFLETLLREVAQRAQEVDQGVPVVILVDALDEAEKNDSDSELNPLCLPRDLPEKVFFIVTTRPEERKQLSVMRIRSIEIKDNDPRNLEDIRKRIWNFIEKNHVEVSPKIVQWGVGERDFVDIITEKSEGNFMYLTYVLEDILAGRLNAGNIDNIRNLPEGLTRYYWRHWELMKRLDNDNFGMCYEKVVCTLALVEEPVSVAQISTLTKLERDNVREVLLKWSPFLNEFDSEHGDKLYSIYHQSFQRFLEEEVKLKEAYKNVLDDFDRIKPIPSFELEKSEYQPTNRNRFSNLVDRFRGKFRGKES